MTSDSLKIKLEKYFGCVKIANFYKQHFSKNRQEVELCPLRILRVPHPHCHPKLIGHFFENLPKTISVSVLMRLYG